MCPLVLLHVVLSREGFAAGWALYILLAGMFLTMAGGVTRCSESVSAPVGLRMRARVFLLLWGGSRAWRFS